MVAILGANSVSGEYEVSNSLRFNDGDSPTLSITPTSTGNRKTWTFSYWIKRSTLSTVQQTFAVGTNASTPWFLNYINSDDTLQIWFHDGTNSYLSTGLNKLRDVSAWYHIMYVVDTTQSTASDRLKVYINGSEMTFNSYSPPAQNFDTQVNTTNTHYIGRAGNGQYFDGYTTEVNFIDGTAKSPTDFGEFDDNGVWIPKKYTGSYGTNGFFLEFKQTGTSQNSSGIGADTSGNDNHFAVTNLAAIDITEDTCTNNFATFNPLFRSNVDNDGTFLEGNCQRDFTDNANRGYGMSTIGVNSGKWYWEIKVIGSDVSRIGIGVGYDGLSAFTSPFYDNNPSLGMHFYSSGSVSANGNTQSYGSSSSVNDIFMYALDMDNHLIWLGKNGSWFNSATVTEIQNSTATNDITTKLSSQTFLNSGEPVFPMVNDLSTTGASQFQINFGNPPFAISSSNTDGKYGNFEYAPPSGYYALCTKRLAEFG